MEVPSKLPIYELQDTELYKRSLIDYIYNYIKLPLTQLEESRMQECFQW